MSSFSFIRSFTVVSGFTFLSRILGYGREMLIAAVIGAGQFSDVFFFALKLPNLFRRLFAEGAFTNVFVPIFSKLFHARVMEAQQFVKDAGGILIAALLLLILAAEVFMPWIVESLAPGFMKDPHKLDLAIFCARLTFPYIGFISLVSLGSSLLSSFNKFAVSSAVPIVLNTCSIVVLWSYYKAAPEEATVALSLTTTLAGILQLAWIILACRKLSLHVPFKLPRLSPHVRTFFKKMVPGFFGVGIYHLNLFVSDIIASFIPGAISYLAFADRINQFPLALIGVSLGTVLLPRLSKTIHQKKWDDVLVLQNKALMFALFLTIPAATALFCLAGPITEMLYERGRFTHEATLATASCLSCFVVGLPAYVLVKVLSSTFFAEGDTKTPLYIAIFSIILNISLNLILMQFFSYRGIALGTSIASWGNSLLFFVLLKKKKRIILSPELARCVIKVAASSVLMASFLVFMHRAYWQGGSAEKMMVFCGMLLGGFVIYMGTSIIFKTVPTKFLKRFRKNK